MPDHPMPYTVVRSNRRTLAVCVLPDGRVEARAPRRFPAAEIERFVRQKADWIAARQTEALGRNREREVLRPAPGGTLPLGGVEYPLVAAVCPLHRDHPARGGGLAGGPVRFDCPVWGKNTGIGGTAARRFCRPIGSKARRGKGQPGSPALGFLFRKGEPQFLLDAGGRRSPRG